MCKRCARDAEGDDANREFDRACMLRNRDIAAVDTTLREGSPLQTTVFVHMDQGHRRAFRTGLHEDPRVFPA